LRRACVHLQICEGRGEGSSEEHPELKPDVGERCRAHLHQAGDGSAPKRIPRLDPARDVRLTRDAKHGAVNEACAEMQRRERDALVVPVHALLIGLYHRERKNAVGLHPESS